MVDPSWGDIGRVSYTFVLPKVHILRAVDELNIMATLKKRNVIHEWSLNESFVRTVFLKRRAIYRLCERIGNRFTNFNLIESLARIHSSSKMDLKTKPLTLKCLIVERPISPVLCSGCKNTWVKYLSISLEH